jgi:hypothetical protein
LKPGGRVPDEVLHARDENLKIDENDEKIKRL